MAIERYVPPALPGVLFQRVERDTELAVGYCARYGITRVSAGAFDFVYRRQPLTQDRAALKLKQPGALIHDVWRDPLTLDDLSRAAGRDRLHPPAIMRSR